MKTVFLLVILAALPVFALAADGLVSLDSPHDVKTTADRMERILQQKGMTVFIRISHSDGAREAGIDLRPTELIVFGNPNVGTPLMQCAQSVAIDLPQKALIWQDAEGRTRLSYNDPAYLKARHSIQGCDAVLEKIGAALAGFAREATRP